MAVTGTGIWYFTNDPAVPSDLFLEKSFDEIGKIVAYTQEVDTTVALADRTILVSGLYSINGPEARFASIATTTLTIPGAPAANRVQSFTLENISIGNEVYTRLRTKSPALETTINQTPDWVHFKERDIPREFENIAIVGPVLDNILVFRGRGAFLTRIPNQDIRPWGDEKLTHYAFRLSEKADPDIGGTLATLFQRIGKNGIIDAWFDEETAELRHLVFTGDGYHSTTTISSINNPPPIMAPL